MVSAALRYLYLPDWTPAFCSDLRQGGRVFGDMMDGFDHVLSQIDLRENMSAIA